MLGRPDKSGGNKAVTLLATCMVLLGGAATCTFIGVVASPDPMRALLIAGGCFGGITFLLWLLRDRHPEAGAASRWNLLAHARRRRVEYHLRLKRPPAGTASNPPPSVDSVRQLAAGANTWVPVKGSPRDTSVE